MSHYLSIPEFYERFPDEKSAHDYIAQQRWGNRPCCPRCESEKVWEIKGGMGYKCGDCPKGRERFSVRTGTVIEHSRVPLQKWLLAINLMFTAHKGFSSVQFAKHLGVTQKTGWHMEHRIRKACESNEDVSLTGEVEIDETYIGGKESNKHASKKLNQGRGAVDKAAVVGLQQRDGKVVAMHVEKANRATIYPIIEKYVEQRTSVYTDDHKVYNNLNRAFDHESVKHSAGEYVNGKASTNSVESFWVLIKHGYYGTHHWWSYKHLHRTLQNIYNVKTIVISLVSVPLELDKQQ